MKRRAARGGSAGRVAERDRQRPLAQEVQQDEARRLQQQRVEDCGVGTARLPLTARREAAAVPPLQRQAGRAGQHIAHEYLGDGEKDEGLGIGSLAAGGGRGASDALCHRRTHAAQPAPSQAPPPLPPAPHLQTHGVSPAHQLRLPRPHRCGPALRQQAQQAGGAAALQVLPQRGGQVDGAGAGRHEGGSKGEGCLAEQVGQVQALKACPPGGEGSRGGEAVGRGTGAKGQAAERPARMRCREAAAAATTVTEGARV